MGYLVYDGTSRIQLEDRVLAHVEMVIILKFRRREGFAMRWRDSSASGDGRSVIWLDPSMPLRLHYEGSRPIAINKEWLEALASAAATTSGLELVDEEGEAITGTLVS
ncbi:ATP-dependent DNA ligase [Leifsonia aquatica]|uniref:DUF7882 domain-containing protein n=2 Tax=Leifsonia aquatica TaxID=144185 RepID=A0A7W4UX72_LEIAQ|nr:ATP-dependent DNA ligase [Leifsonia aquatica]MBB2967964.1 hypothetical protein [Leifsonia aquatica]